MNIGEAIYLEQAQLYLTALLVSSSYYEPEATDGWQSILRRASARWGDPEVGAVFGDYFLLEAMVSTLLLTIMWVFGARFRSSRTALTMFAGLTMVSMSLH